MAKYYSFSQPGNVTNSLDGTLSDVDATNPLFNFDQEFFNKLHGVSPDELARSVPYISLHTVDLQGEIIEDLNVNFFFKTTDLSKLGQNIRYADRPTMSLKSLEVSTSLASGYLYYTDVNLTLRIHSPADLTRTTITSLIFPGMPHLLEYGWNSPNEFLNDSKERLLFQIVTYDLNIDETGQVDLVVRGKALNDNFNNVLVGDSGDLIQSEIINNSESDGIARNREKVEKYVEYLNNTKTSGGQQSNDYDLVRILAENYKKIENKARGTISTKFKEKLDQLGAAATDGIIPLHDLVYIMCNDTFDGLTSAWPRVGEFRFIYGDVNETIRGSTVPASLAEFPINLKKFFRLIKSEVQNGAHVITLQRFLNLVADNFIENEDIWKDQLSDSDSEFFNKPEIVINFSNRNGAGDAGIMECTFHDVKFGIPATTTQLPVQKASKSDAETAVVDSSSQPLPILRVGHANSFVKKLNMAQITDQAMKAVFIERAFRDRKDGPRSTKPAAANIAATSTTPLTLPLKGNLRVLGHPDWRPFRSLFLDVGIFLVDGVYKLMEVRHILSADGFDTDIVLMYN